MSEPGQIIILNGTPRRKTWGTGGSAGDTVPRPVQLWQSQVHDPGIYDLEVDTSLLHPKAYAEVIQRRLEDGPRPSAFEQLAAMYLR